MSEVVDALKAALAFAVGDGGDTVRGSTVTFTEDSMAEATRVLEGLDAAIPIAEAMEEVVKAAENISLPEPVPGRPGVPSWERSDFNRLKHALDSYKAMKT